MKKYRFTPQARADLFDIWNFIARDNREAADHVEAAIFRSCDLLSNSPLIGQTRKDLTSLPVRFWVVHPYRNYLIVYDPANQPLRIIRILHGARHVAPLLT
jgi:plasmid stabilization system protein ParE